MFVLPQRVCKNVRLGFLVSFSTGSSAIWSATFWWDYSSLSFSQYLCTFISFSISISLSHSLYLSFYFNFFISSYLFSYITFMTANFGNKSFFYVSIVLEGMYTYNTAHIGDVTLCLCLFCCRGYVHMYDWAFWKWDLLFLFLFLLGVCTHEEMACTNVWQVILAIISCAYICVVVEGINTCKTRHFCN